MRQLEHTIHSFPTYLERQGIREHLRRFHGAPRCASSLSGRMVDGRFSIIEKIGEGGNGEVYLALDSKSGDRVAFKLATDKKDRKKMNQLIVNEACVLSKITHENIVGFVAEGSFLGRRYVVMEHLEGMSLDKMIEGSMGIAPGRAVKIILQLCDALGAVHESGFIHRDVKPGNIFITNGARVKLIDFGMSESMVEPPERDPGVISGTVSYLAPETIYGKSYDRRVDVYATGVLLYRVISGIEPFGGEDVLEVLSKHLNALPRRIGDIVRNLKIPLELEDLIMKALAKAPQDRFADMAQMKSALERCPSWNAAIPVDNLGFAPTELHALSLQL